MSQRPRLADDGRLLVPDEVAYEPERERFVSRHAGRDEDPFEWTAEHLLLTEGFARLDLGDEEACARWFERNGVIDWIKVFALFLGRPPVAMSPREGWDVTDPKAIVEAFQGNVRWHLAMLVRLSEHREDRVWDPTWGQVVLTGAAEDLIIGGRYAGDHVRDSGDRGLFEDEEAVRGAVADWPRVLLGDQSVPSVRLDANEDRERRASLEASARSTVLGTSWLEGVKLVRLIIEPQLIAAVERRFTTEFMDVDAGAGVREVLVPKEMRIWRSILDPIHVQLFEALRRITEGHPGAATCRECGQPFLVLDARRRFFCNERERTRHAHRERRIRLSGQISAVSSASGTLTIERTPSGTIDEIDLGIDEQ